MWRYLMSRTILNPDGKNSFTSLVCENYFVDKTNFIGEMIDRLDSSDRKLIAFTRPRRFGKTVTALMLSSFFSKGADCRTIFSKLNIATEYKKGTNFNYEKFLNKFDVIYWDLNAINTDFKSYQDDPSIHIEGIDDLVDYLQFTTLLELKKNKEFNEKINQNPLIGKKSLKQAFVATQNKFAFIMDEWDLIYREYREDEQLQKKFIELLTGLFKAYDGLECFSLVYLTGILPIKKYNSQSALNNFDEINMLTPGNFAPYFGFTDEDVNRICELPQNAIPKSLLKEWYEGYKFKMTVMDAKTKKLNVVDVDIYNPNSVCKAISRQECIGYWSKTSSQEEVERLINMDFKGIKRDIVKLVDGGKVPFNSDNFQNDMVTIKDKNDIICLLVCLGYLCCTEKSNGGKVAYVPNKEIKSSLLALVKAQDWSNRISAIKRSDNLLNAIIKKQNSAKVAQIIQEIHNSPQVSLLDYNTEESLTYCVITGLQWATQDDYSCYREDQTGKGRVDLVYEPASEDLPLIIIEFKCGKSAEVALKQIKRQEYYKRYVKQHHKIVMVGINYSKTTKEHDCVIESLIQ